MSACLIAGAMVCATCLRPAAAEEPAKGFPIPGQNYAPFNNRSAAPFLVPDPDAYLPQKRVPPRPPKTAPTGAPKSASPPKRTPAPKPKAAARPKPQTTTASRPKPQPFSKPKLATKGKNDTNMKFSPRNDGESRLKALSNASQNSVGGFPGLGVPQTKGSRSPASPTAMRSRTAPGSGVSKAAQGYEAWKKSLGKDRVNRKAP